MPADTEISSEEWAAWRSFIDMRRRLGQTLERELQQAGDISGPEYEILMAVFAEPNRRIRAKNLAEHLGWEKSRVSHQVTRMEKRGLVERTECDTDLRGSWVGLTADGKRAVLGTMREHSASIRRYFLDVLTAEELRVFADASGRILSAISDDCPAIDDDAVANATTPPVAHTVDA